MLPEDRPTAQDGVNAYDDTQTLRGVSVRQPSRPQARQSADEIPTAGPELPRVVLGPRIGSGGMAVVRQGEQPSLQRVVAIKSAITGDSADALVKEARLTGSLEHPDIVPVHDIVTDLTDDGAPHVVMQRIEGEPWSRLLKNPERVQTRFSQGVETTDLLVWNLRILLRLCSTLAFAHSEGVLHRDIKPANVIIGRFGQVYLMDWGVAIRMDELPQAPPDGDEGPRIFGTPAYMAPEMVLEDDWAPLGPKTDVYLLGAVLHHIVAGHPPRRTKTLLELVEAVTTPPPISPDWPLAELLEASLSAHPDDRPSVEAFRQQVEQYLDRRGLEELARNAEARREQLESRIAAHEQRSEEADRLAIVDLYGACRFGFEEALRGAPDLRLAQVGLRESTLAMARWELRNGDHRAASLLLARLSDVPGALSEEVEAVAARREAEAAELAARRSDDDAVAHSWTRIPIGLGMLAVWIVPPVGTALVGLPEGYLKQGIITACTTVGTFVLLPVFWPWMRATQYNRVLVVAIAASPPLVAIFLTAAWLGGVPGDSASAMRVFVFVMTTVMVTCFADWRIFPSIFGFVIALFIGSWSPAWSEPVLGIANIVVVVNVLLVAGARSLAQRASR